MSAVGTALAIERHPTGLVGWRWFSVLAALTGAIELRAWGLIDWHSDADVQALIGFNWRLAAPYLLITFLASPLNQLAPSRLSRWLLANRRYTGLAFASVAAWQLASIGALAWRFPRVLAEFHDDTFQYVEDSIFVAIIVMSATSFRIISRHMSAALWRRVHKTGIYLIAGLLTANNVYYAVNRSDPAYLVISIAFALVWALRALAWWRARRTLTGWGLFWGLAAAVNAGVLGMWSFTGIESAPTLQRMLSLCAALAAGAFLVAFAARPVRRLARNSGSRWLEQNQRPFLLAAALALGWYLLFIALHRVPGPHAVTRPLPLGWAVAIVKVALLSGLASATGPRWRERVPRAYRRTVSALPVLVLGGVASLGLVSAGVSALTLVLCAAFSVGWLLQLAAVLWPTAPEPDAA